MSSTADVLENLRTLEAKVEIHTAPNGPVVGWAVSISFDKPHRQAQQVRTPFGVMLRVDPEVEAEADTSTDYTHSIEITVWDPSLERAVVRASESFMAAYAASAAHAPGAEA